MEKIVVALRNLMTVKVYQFVNVFTAGKFLAMFILNANCEVSFLWAPISYHNVQP